MFLPAYRFFFNGFCHLPLRFIFILYTTKQSILNHRSPITSDIGHKHPLPTLPSSIFPNAVPSHRAQPHAIGRPYGCPAISLQKAQDPLYR